MKKLLVVMLIGLASAVIAQERSGVVVERDNSSVVRQSRDRVTMIDREITMLQNRIVKLQAEKEEVLAKQAQEQELEELLGCKMCDKDAKAILLDLLKENNNLKATVQSKIIPPTKEPLKK